MSLEVICWFTVLVAGLLVVVLFAERLPVAHVPEQITVSTVWDDMVNHGGKRVSRRVFLQTHHTEAVFSEELSACFLPACTVTTVFCRAYRLGVKRQMLFAELFPGIYQFRAAGMTAGFSCFVRHGVLLVQILFSDIFFFRLDNLLNQEYNNRNSVIRRLLLMFIGRKTELALLTELYNSSKFEFLVLYGRRRVGKTSLLGEFAKDRKTINFSAQVKNDALNLADFSKVVQMHFDGQGFGSFDGWESAFEYIGNRAGDERILVIIDEFPFIAVENPSVKSILQHTIDHTWKQKNIFLILCGSSVSFMENEVMGYKSPLYGRSTAQLELLPFDYLDSAKFFPHYSNIDKLITYGILGGIPCYLENFDESKSVAENLETRVLRTGAFLKEETQVLLRMELRDPAVYNSIFEAISDGASRMNDISTKIREESQKCSKYIATLRSLKLLDKVTPVGEDESSKKSLYRISDNFFQFWYHFISKEKSYYEILGSKKAAEEIMETESISDFMGEAFEQICRQYMVRRAKAGTLPFIPHDIGKWWGNNPAKRKQDDMDILLLDKKQESAVFCECKFRNTLFDKQEYDDLMSASEIFTQVKNRYYYLFSKSGFTEWVQNEAKRNDCIHLITVDDLFQFDLYREDERIHG